MKDKGVLATKAKREPWAGAVTEVLPLAKILLWHGNPRRFRRGLRELGESMRRNGQLDPLIGRRSKEHEGCIEVADGTRRRGAAELAGIPELRIEVRELTDREMVDVALEANGGRDDFHPLEEAEGYRKLVEDHGVTVAEVAAKHGVPDARVNGRLRLCKLHDILAKAFEADRMTVGAALQLARLSEIVQVRVWEELVKRSGTFAGPNVGESEVRGYLSRTIFLPIVGAPFSLRDKNLVPNAGSCDECPKRTNNQRHLFETPTDETDACTDSACWVAKRDAHVVRLRKAADERKQPIIEGPKAKAIFMQGAPDHLATGAGYLELDRASGHLLDDKGQPRTLERVVGAGARELAVLAIDPLGNPRKLVPIAAAKKILRECGHHELAKSIPDPSEQRKTELAVKERSRAEKDAVKERREATVVAMVDLEKAAASAAASAPKGFWTWLALAAARNAANEAVTRAWRRRGGDATEAPGRQAMESDLLAKAGGDDGQRGLAVELLASRGAFSSSPTEGGTELLDGALLVFLGVSLDGLIEQREGEAREEKKGAKKKGKATKKKVVAKPKKKLAKAKPKTKPKRKR